MRENGSIASEETLGGRRLVKVKPLEYYSIDEWFKDTILGTYDIIDEIRIL